MTASPGLPAALVTALYSRAGAARWGLSIADFERRLVESAARALGTGAPSPRDLERYVSALHVEDLALASACAAGVPAAWDHFIATHRPLLYRAADALDPTGSARDLADGLYADLFGLDERDGVRQSLFRYFHGRSSLATWLRAVLAQRLVDRGRVTRRFEPLPEDDSPLMRREIAADPDRSRLTALVRTALSAAIGALAPRDRLRLMCYYVQDLTLAAIGRLLGEHEATVSRHLSRTRRGIRESVERSLREACGLDDRAIAQCFDAVMADAGSLDVAELIGATDGKIAASPRSSR
jgi:RNA polymerase sigma-70 factor (ECF subfamily)